MSTFTARPIRTLWRISLLLSVLAAIWVCWLRPLSPRTGPIPLPLADGWAIDAPVSQGINATRLDKVVSGLLDAPLNVHSVLVERHGKLISESYQGGKDRSVYALVSTRQSFGPATKQDIRSIGKSITSLLYGIALDEGKVPALSTRIFDAYPALVDIATAAKRNIVVRDLLNMANGLSWHEGDIGLNDELRLFWKQDIPRYVLSHDMQAAPKAIFNYNGGSTAILADLISNGTGMALDDYARSRLFEPLGIHDWAWVADLHGRPMAFNGLRMRPRDLLKIGRLVLDGGQWQGRQIVPAAWLSESMQTVINTDVRDYRYAHQWWGGVAQWRGQSIQWHAGFGNGGQRLYLIPALDMAIVTTAGAYDEIPTAIRVNDLVQQVVDCVDE